MFAKTQMAAIILALAAVPAAAATPATAATSSVLACSFATYAPDRQGSNVVGWGEKWGCGTSTQWTITLQRHRSAWWQNEAVNYHTGDNWVSVGAGCASGTWTYRTILESSAGSTISANKTITC
ncbi:hypothetical protein [Amycolatopsis sp. cmx-4-68]|uniref:hypothetical protein n=1 Tax=Amycolatopsis sp. cmx-4-68 TaxID=2790938 RepID=UPI00397D8E06